MVSHKIIRVDIRKKLQFMDNSDLNKLLTSAAGAYIASWVMGIRDRHQVNFLYFLMIKG